MPTRSAGSRSGVNWMRENEALMLSKPLHFGDYGGLPLKIVWALLDLLTIWVLATGLVLWWQRRASHHPAAAV